MCGQHRADGGGFEEGTERIGGDAGVPGAAQRLRHRAVAWRRSGDRVSAGAADPVLVLGDVGEMRKIAEGADDLVRLGARQAIHDLAEFAPRGIVLVAAEAYRGLADLFDDVEDPLALLLAHGVAEDPAEEPRVLAQRSILVSLAWRCQPRFPGLRHGLLRVQSYSASAAISSLAMLGTYSPCRLRPRQISATIR